MARNQKAMSEKMQLRFAPTALDRLDEIADELGLPTTDIARAFILPEIHIADPVTVEIRRLAREVAQRLYGRQVSEPVSSAA